MNGDYTASKSSEFVILEIQQKSAWHNGGMLLFGKDKMLYASIGDDMSRNLLQTRKSLLGSFSVLMSVNLQKKSRIKFTR